MRICAALLILAVLFPTSASAWPGQVVGITDGDTLTVLRDGHEQVKIRLYGIDTPEKKQPWGNRAKVKLSELAFNQQVEVVVLDVDRFGRTVARIFVEGAEVAPKLVRSGVAWVYTRYCYIHVA